MYSVYIILCTCEYTWPSQTSHKGTQSQCESGCWPTWSTTPVWLTAPNGCSRILVSRSVAFSPFVLFLFIILLYDTICTTQLCRVFLANQFVELMPYLKKYVQDSKQSFLEQFLSHVSACMRKTFSCYSYTLPLELCGWHVHLCN